METGRQVELKSKTFQEGVKSQILIIHQETAGFLFDFGPDSTFQG